MGTEKVTAPASTGAESGLAATIGRYVAFTRPFTLLPPTFGVISGAICAWGSYWNPDPSRAFGWGVFLTIVLGSACAALLNAASNVINQIYDLEIDRINKPDRMLPSDRISMKSAWAYTWVLYAIAVLPVWFVVIYPAHTFHERLLFPDAALPVSGAWDWIATLVTWHAVFVIYALGMFFTFVYSAPGLGRSKRHAIWANVTIAIPRGMLLKVAGWGMVGPVLTAEPWYIGLIFALFLVGAASTKDFSDMEGDRAQGCYTLPVRFGVRRAAFMIAPSFIVPWLLIPLGAFIPDPFDPTGNHPILTGNPLGLLALGLGLTIWGAYTVWLILRDPEAMATMENHPSWTHMYLMMMAAQIGFAVAYLV